MAGCSSKAAIQRAAVKALENPTPTELTEKAADVITQTEDLPHDPPASCPVTVPRAPSFMPPSPYDSLGFEDEFWYGSNSLWTALRQDGV